jgi:hypothetical protein
VSFVFAHSFVVLGGHEKDTTQGDCLFTTALSTALDNSIGFWMASEERRALPFYGPPPDIFRGFSDASGRSKVCARSLD